MLFVKGFHREYELSIRFFRWLFKKCGLIILDINASSFENLKKGGQTFMDAKEAIKERLCPMDIARHALAPAVCQLAPYQPDYCRKLDLVRLECPDCGCVIYRTAKCIDIFPD